MHLGLFKDTYVSVLIFMYKILVVQLLILEAASVTFGCTCIWSDILSNLTQYFQYQTIFGF